MDKFEPNRKAKLHEALISIEKSGPRGTRPSGGNSDLKVSAFRVFRGDPDSGHETNTSIRSASARAKLAPAILPKCPE
jgi:hypothetical protein